MVKDIGGAVEEAGLAAAAAQSEAKMRKEAAEEISRQRKNAEDAAADAKKAAVEAELFAKKADKAQKDDDLKEAQNQVSLAAEKATQSSNAA